jgi:hypothetical protein
MQVRGSRRSIAEAILFIPARKPDTMRKDIKKRKTLHKKS